MVLFWCAPEHQSAPAKKNACKKPAKKIASKNKLLVRPLYVCTCIYTHTCKYTHVHIKFGV